MLKTLTVWNLALIDHLQVDFTAGLNILTGETGAGKSLLLGALGLLLGQRSSTDAIRSGGTYLRVEAVFTEVNHAVHDFLQQNAILDESDELIIVRQINRNGRNIIQVNGCQVTVTLLKNLGAFLIDIHGQNENQSLLRPEEQLALVDRAAPQFASHLAQYQEKYNAYKAVQEKLREKKAAAKNYADRMEILRWQNDEINAANIDLEKDKELEEQIKKLSNIEKIADLVRSTYILLSGENTDAAALLSLSKMQKNLSSLTKYDKHFTGIKKIVDDSYIQLQEASYEIRDYIDNIDYDSSKLNRLLKRSDDLEKLCKKYGPDLDTVLASQQKIQDELNEIENYDSILDELQKALAAAKEELHKAALSLKELRKKTAAVLSKRINEQLFDLGMSNAKFIIEIVDLDNYTKLGTENAQILFTANVGEDCKVLQKTASGGELSRIALAIKTVTASSDTVASMVFDEIDTGISGKTAQMVAERILAIASYKQVLCITHLPQIACMADTHFYIDKAVRSGHTTTRVKKLSAGEQLNEIARMTSGIDITAASLDNAMEMLNNAKLKKKHINESVHKINSGDENNG